LLRKLIRPLRGASANLQNMRHFLESINTDGFAIIPHVLDDHTIAQIGEAIDGLAKTNATKQRADSTFGIRNLLTLVPPIAELARSAAVRACVEPILGSSARAVRGIFFDKTPDTNWKVPWHQDLSIAVKERHEVDGFGPWSVKAGTQHVQPPVEVLENMLTVRLHLDEADEENGALRVIAGSHRHGRLSAGEIQQWRAEGSTVSCPVPRGGALIMRPLLLHASSVATKPAHRRVVHLEFAGCDLPGGLEWQIS